MTNPLLKRLAIVRRRFRIVTILSGVFAVLAVVLGMATLVGLVDWYAHLPSLLRASALVGALVGAGYLVAVLLVHPLSRRSDNLSLALRIEAQHPELNDSLASTIQFLEQPDSPLGGDPLMRAKAIERATAQAETFDFHAILDYRFLGVAALALIVSLAAAGHFLYHEPELSKTAVMRLIEPFGNHTWTRIDVPRAVTRLAVGQPFRLRGHVEGILPGTLKIEVQAQNPFNKKFETRPDIVVRVEPDPSKRSGNINTALDVSSRPLTFQYRITGNDGSFPPRRGRWHKVEVLQPPSFTMLEGLPSPQIALVYPRYTDLPSPQKLSPGTRHLEMIQGTEVVYRAKVDRPLKSASIELRPIDQAIRLATLTGLVGNPLLLPQVGPASFHSAFSWFVPVTLDETGTILSARFRPWLAGSYLVRLLDTNDLIREYEADLRVGADPVPVVHLQRPASTGSYLPTAEVPFKLLVEDDIYAVHAVFLEYRRKDAKGDWVDAAPTRLPIYGPGLLGESLRVITRVPWPFEMVAPVKAKRLELALNWGLKKQFKVGDIITLQVCGDDYCDLFTPRVPGRSHEIELRIVAPDDLARQLDENLMQVQQELVGLKRLEAEVQNLLNEVPKDKADAKALDQVIEAQQKAKQVQERIGAKPNEGVREKLEKMQQMIKDNKLPDSEMQDQVKNLAQELENLVQEEFPRLESQLNEVRKELTGMSKQSPEKKKEPSKSQLDKAKDTNKEIEKALSDLARSLDRWADLAQLKGQTRELIEKQNNLAEQTAKLKEQSDIAPKGQANELMKEEANKLAAQQRKLEQEVQDLLDKIAKSQSRQNEMARQESAKAEEGDKDAAARAEEAKDVAQKLRKAQGVASMDELKKKLDDAAKNLETKRFEEPKSHAAHQEQKHAVKTMEKMLAAMEGQKNDDLDRLRKKQRDADRAAGELDKMQKKLRDTQKQANNPEAKVDPKEKAKQLREVAEDLREQARQLQRLQEQKAARELQKAAEALDEAAKKLDAGENAEDQEQEARERIDRAQQALEHLQEELAREQLARIGDRLKGLKERQDAAVERNKVLHEKVLHKTKWSRGLIETLEADRQSQLGLARETQSLEEKLKGAMVFEHILKKAGKAMDRAGEAMAQRKEIAKERQLKSFEAEEKADEVRRHEEIHKLQKLAADRLDRLLEAIKNAPPQVAKKHEPKKEGGEEGPPMEPQGGMKAQDGIPPMAQLKALKAEQVEVHERTTEFSRQNPDLANLPPRQMEELRELTEEQARLRQLFEQMTAPREGDMP